MDARRVALRLAALVSAVTLASCATTPTPTPTPTLTLTRNERVKAALRMADFILSLQDASGAVEDVAGWGTVNTDSNMEYALIGLAAAYDATKDRRYLDGFERGVAWLADREELDDHFWRGSWRYSYDAHGNHVAVPPGDGYADARGVDTSSALLAYLVYLARRVDPDSDLPGRYETHVRAALEFVEFRCLGEEGLSRSCHLIPKEGGAPVRSDMNYTADQADVWLGFRAGFLLYGEARYRDAAEQLRSAVESTFFSGERGRYPVGVSGGEPDWSLGDFGPIQCQGWLAWAWGPSDANARAVAWLESKAAGDGSVRCFPGDPAYSLSAATLLLGRSGLVLPAPERTARWLSSPPVFDAASGGVRDSLRDGMEPCNNAGLSAVALLEWPAFAEIGR